MWHPNINPLTGALNLSNWHPGQKPEDTLDQLLSIIFSPTFSEYQKAANPDAA
jgi:ubiquitin-protein ligase